MKHLFSLTVVVLSIIYTSFGQPCLPEGITFNNQYSIDQFAANYPGCQSIAGNITIGGTGTDITNLNGLSQLTSIGGNLYILGCNSMANLTGLHHLVSIGGNLDIVSNDGLSTMNGLNNLSSIGGRITVSHNDGMISLVGLEKIQEVPGFVLIGYNESLESLSGLQQIDSIGGYLQILDNDALVDLSGLENLAYIGSFVEMVDNNMLADLNGLENLRSIGGNLSVYLNPKLVALTGLHHVHTIGGALYIGSNPLLSDLEGLDSLQAIHGNLRISFNAQLTTLNGLQNLQSMGGYLEIRDNANLVTLKALEHINPGSIVSVNPSVDDIEIYNNPKLDTCAVASVCGVLSLPGTTTDIHGNAAQCNSEPVIQALCDSFVGVETIEGRAGAVIYPNPAGASFILQCDYSADAALIDQFGRWIQRKQLVPGDNLWDISQLLPGVYFIKTEKGDILRLVKQ